MAKSHFRCNKVFSMNIKYLIFMHECGRNNLRNLTELINEESTLVHFILCAFRRVQKIWEKQERMKCENNTIKKYKPMLPLVFRKNVRPIRIFGTDFVPNEI
jgi:hypothetical protein